MTILDIPPGPGVGKVLEYLFEKVMDNPCLNNPKDLKLLVTTGNYPGRGEIVTGDRYV